MADVATLGLRVDATGAIRDVRTFGEAADRTAKQTITLERAVVTLVGGFGAYKALQLARETLALADAYTNLRARLSVVTSGVENLARVQRQLFQVSNDTRTAVESNVALYSSLARSTRALGVNQQDLIGMTRSVAQSLIISGAGASEANSAVRQFAQGLASGVLRGDEFNSIMENAPRLQQAFLDTLGVTSGQLRAMAEAGQITSAVMTNVLLKSAASINAEFAKMPLTVGGAITQLRNAMLAYVGAGDQTAGASHTIAEAISLLAKNLGTLVQSLVVVAGVMAGRWLASFAAAHAQSVTMYAQVARGNAVLLDSVTAQRGAAAAAVEHAQAQRAASAQVIAALQAEQAQLVATKAAARTAFSGASVRVEQATSARELTRIDPSMRDVAGGQAGAQRELTAAYAARTAAQQTLNASNTRLAATDAELIAASTALVAAEARVVEAETARAAVMVRTSLVTRAAAAATGALSGAMALLGGPIGVAILAALALNAALDKWIEKQMKAVELTEEQEAAYRKALETAHGRAAQQTANAAALTAEQQRYAEQLRKTREELGDEYADLSRENQGLTQIQLQRDLATAAMKRERAEREVRRKFQPEDQKALLEEIEAIYSLAVATAYYGDKTRMMASAGATAAEAMKEAIELEKKTREEMHAPFKNLTENLQREFGNLFSGIFTDGVRTFNRLGDVVRNIFARVVGEVLSLFATRRLVPALMGTMGMGGGGGGGAGQGNYLGGLGAQMAGQAAAGGLAGGLIGYGVGTSLYSSSHGAAGNNIRGALGGAASGAAAGFMVGGPIGAAVGGLAGLVAGIAGVGSAAKAAAKAMAEAVKAVTLSMDALRANVHGDTLGAAIAAVEADRAQRARAIEEAWSGGGAGSDRVLWRTQQHKELNALEDERIRQLREEYALTQQRAYEDLEVRALAAQGRSREAEALRLQLAQQREMEQYVKDKADPATIALLAQVQAQEKLAAATNRATTSALNMVEGYNIVAEAFRFSGNTTGMVGASGSGYTAPTQFAVPTGGQRGTPTPTQPIVIENIMQLDGREIARNSKKVYIDEASRSGDGDAYNWGRGL